MRLIIIRHRTWLSRVVKLLKYFGIHIQVWSEELALLAEGFAAKCNADFDTDHSPRFSTFDSIGRNFYVLSDLDILNQVNYSTIVNTWFSESDGYSYDKTLGSPVETTLK